MSSRVISPLGGAKEGCIPWVYPLSGIAIFRLRQAKWVLKNGYSESSRAVAKSHPSFYSPLIHSVVSSYSVSEEQKPWSDCADMQVNIGLRWLHMPKDLSLLGARPILFLSPVPLSSVILPGKSNRLDNLNKKKKKKKKNETKQRHKTCHITRGLYGVSTHVSFNCFRSATIKVAIVTNRKLAVYFLTMLDHLFAHFFFFFFFFYIYIVFFLTLQTPNLRNELFPLWIWTHLLS